MTTEGIVGILLSVIASILVGLYFYRKSIKKHELTLFLENFSSLLPTLKDAPDKALAVTFHHEPLTNLFECRLIIANTGDLPISDIIEPLTIHIPDFIQIIDSKVNYVYPSGRSVKCITMTHGVVAEIKLLNPKEYFVLRMLFTGEVENYLEDVKKQRIERLTERRGAYDSRTERHDSAIDHIHVPESTILKTFKISITAPSLPPHLALNESPLSKTSKPENKPMLALMTVIHGVLSFTLYYLVTKEMSLSEITSEPFLKHLLLTDERQVLRIVLFVGFLLGFWHLVNSLISLVKFIIRFLYPRHKGMRFHHQGFSE